MPSREEELRYEAWTNSPCSRGVTSRDKSHAIVMDRKVATKQYTTKVVSQTARISTA